MSITMIERTEAATGAGFSHVLETPAATPAEAERHFAQRLALETDPWDVYEDSKRGATGFVVIDARGADAYAECHLPGAVSLPYRTISPETTASFSRDDVLIVYCWSPVCNAACKACVRLAALGFRVKEMVGGIEYWLKEGYPIIGTTPEKIG